MKRTAIFLAALALWCGAAAQEITPPRFQGADAKRFMARLIGESEKIAVEKQVPASDLSPQVAVGFTVDTTGTVTEWRFLDNTCEGRDYTETEPATARTREIMTEALGRLEKWTPAQKAGRPATYSWRLTMRLPVEKIAGKQEADPLLFLGEDPGKTFHDWARIRVRYDERFSSRGVSGLVHVRFYIEPDGRITIGEVVQSPDDKLAKEVVRVIRNSKGKWTPRKVRGVPQRTAYDYRINFT
ncbi:energy transducer TonB [uncultured Alistipes sp.]|jgi:TonB family protein|uniref:energy transducer TonB n=1 Tax=uncultured Alistipes sp. TaxID=538949 RepID=UPI0025E0E2F5|nr:TonB family protein [uncultured Alistipes sp.]